jgi:Domain of unknown function (DUF4160)/Protein of unknown function (DUF2442)
MAPLLVLLVLLCRLRPAAQPPGVRQNVAVERGRGTGVEKTVPIISSFFGIVIRMFYEEHGVPHFHAEHQGQHVSVAFDGQVLAGTLRSARALRLIAEWADLHRAELEANWRRVQTGETLDKIAPLDWGETMTFLPHVVRAEYRGGHSIQLTFNDGLERVVDFARWIRGPVFEPLRDVAYFQRFFLEGGTVAWPNGADIAPETLYEQAKATVAA